MVAVLNRYQLVNALSVCDENIEMADEVAIALAAKHAACTCIMADSMTAHPIHQRTN